MSQRTITRSVGENGSNEWLDVRTIQELLLFVPITENGPITLDVDGICGPQTIKAIHDFQLHHFGWKGTDGRVDPDQQSLQKLKEYEEKRGVFQFTICRLEYDPLPEPRTADTPDKFYLIEGGGNSRVYCWTPMGKPKPAAIDIMKAQSSRQRFIFTTKEPRTTEHFQTQTCMHSEATGDIDNEQLTSGRFWIYNLQNWELITLNWQHTWASPAAHAFSTQSERGVFHTVKA